MSAKSAICRIYLVLPEGLPGTLDRLEAALSASPVASVLIRPHNSATTAIQAAMARALVEAAQRHGIAALIADDAALARTLRADGVHLGPGNDLLTRYNGARSILGKDAIVGVDCGGSRHLAMEAGEAGADYIAFGKTLVKLPPTADEDGTPAPSAEFSTPELVQWWSEIFEVPCVALDASDTQEQLAFVEAGADFLGLTITADQPAHAVADMLRSAVDITSRSKAGS